MEKFLFYIIGFILGAPLIGLSLLSLVRIANGMGLSSIFGTKTSAKVATSD
jgi:hypothetical protein